MSSPRPEPQQPMMLEHAPLEGMTPDLGAKFEGDTTDAQTWMAFLEDRDSAETLVLLAMMIEGLGNEFKTVAVMAASPDRPRLAAAGLALVADVLARLCRLNQMPVHEILESAGQPFTRCATPPQVMLQQARALNDQFNAIRRQRGQAPTEGLRLAPINQGMILDKHRKPKKK